jgi:hypothetical protein
MDDPPFGAFGSIPDVLGAQTEVAQWFLSEVPGLDEALRGLNDPIPFVLQHAVGGNEPLDWLGALINQLVNEVFDLTQDAVTGRGRPALKSARTLFELLVTAKDVVDGSWTMADRYDRHRWIVWRDLADLEDRTHRGHLSRQRAHARKIERRQVDRNATAAIADYGSGFRRAWHPETLRHRAESYGLGDDYEWYRLASAVLHGSAGGIIGTYIKVQGGPNLHRTGSAIGLAPDALRFGLRWAGMAFDALTPALGDITHMVTAAISKVEALVPSLERVALDYDWELWRSLEPTKIEAFVLVTRWGKPRWYLRAGSTEWVRPAIEPQGLTEAQRDSFDEMINGIRSTLRDDGDCHSMYMAVVDERVFPEPGSAWTRSPQMFLRPEFRWDAPSEPRGVEYIERVPGEDPGRR